MDIVAYSSIRVERRGFRTPVDDFAQGRTVYTRSPPRVVPDLAQLETPSKTLLHGTPRDALLAWKS